MKKAGEPKFGKTRIPNLLRHTKTGVYYARVVHQGRQNWKSLGVENVSDAEPLLAAFKDAVIHGRNASSTVDGTRTFGACAAIYEQRIKTETIARGSRRGHPLSPATQEFRVRPAAALKRTWPTLWQADIGSITPGECTEWYGRFSTTTAAAYTPTGARSSVAGNSPTVTNACITYLRRVFEVGKEKGHLTENPAMVLKRKAPNKKHLNLPNKKQFAAIIAHVRSGPGRCPDDTADLIEGLAYTGMRLHEATSLRWTDVKLDEGIIEIRGDDNSVKLPPDEPEVKRTLKTVASAREIPIMKAMKGLLKRIPKTGPNVFNCQGALGSLESACTALGIAVLTHHDLRHLFATTCVQQNADIPTLSSWLGHSDGGALAMKTYWHFNRKHSSAVAAKIKF